MGQKTSWKFLIPASLQKGQITESLAEEISAAGKILVQTNLEAGCISSP